MALWRYSFTILVYLTALVKLSSTQRKRCPTICRCHSSWLRGTTTVVVDCSKKGLLKIPTLKDGVPKDATSFVLNGNFLQKVPKDAFRSFRYLREIYLYKNFISKIDKDSFNGCRRVEKLSLHSNRLKNLENGTFRQMYRLRSLHLFSNFLESINPLSFQGLRRLQKLYLHENLLRFIPRGTFQGTRSLGILTLHRNYITEVYEGAFSSMRYLMQLYLHQNKLTNISSGSFSGCNRLVKMTLGQNLLENITGGAFNGLYSLHELYIERNMLVKISRQSFTGLHKLKKLVLDFNQISEIGAGAFQGLQNAETLSLTSNKLTYISHGMFDGFNALQSLYLQGNNIEEVKPKSFNGLNELQTLYLFRNRIFSLEKESFQGLDNLQELNLGVNNLTAIENDLFLDTPQLLTLSINSNRLKMLPSKAFHGLKSLRKLYLYFNKISYIAEGALADLQNIENIYWSPPSNLLVMRPQLRSIQSNELYCDCNAMWMKEWLTMMEGRVSAQITCSGPLGLKGRNITSVPKSRFVCDTMKIYVTPRKTVSVPGGIAELHCLVGPGAVFTWLKNGTKLTTGRYGKYLVTSAGFLRIYNTSYNDIGEYVCMAENKAGIIATSAIIDMGAPAEILGSKNEIITVESPGVPIVLDCKVIGSPKPTIEWIKQEQSVQESENLFVTQNGSLVIMRMKPENEGIYTCQATNVLATALKSSRVYLGQATNCIPSCRYGGYCIAKYVCQCMPSFTGNACEKRVNTVDEENEIGNKNTDKVETYSSGLGQDKLDMLGHESIGIDLQSGDDEDGDDEFGTTQITGEDDLTTATTIRPKIQTEKSEESLDPTVTSTLATSTKEEKSTTSNPTTRIVTSTNKVKTINQFSTAITTTDKPSSSSTDTKAATHQEMSTTGRPPSTLFNAQHKMTTTDRNKNQNVQLSMTKPKETSTTVASTQEGKGATDGKFSLPNAKVITTTSIRSSQKLSEKVDRSKIAAKDLDGSQQPVTLLVSSKEKTGRQTDRRGKDVTSTHPLMMPTLSIRRINVKSTIPPRTPDHTDKKGRETKSISTSLIKPASMDETKSLSPETEIESRSKYISKGKNNEVKTSEEQGDSKYNLPTTKLDNNKNILKAA